MKTLPQGLQDHLDSGVTTLCHCWRVRLVTGETLGFTDHDQPLGFDGTVFEAQAGFTGSEIESSLGLAVDNLEAAGALQSGRLDETRLRAGHFDHAEVEVWRVNWSEVSQRVLMRKGHLGEVSYGDGAFRAEVRGLAHLLGQTRGRVYQQGCDAKLGDARCGVDLSGPRFTAGATVTAVTDDGLSVSGLTVADGWFSHGTLRNEEGRVVKVKRHRNFGAVAQLTLSLSPDLAIAVGARVTLTAGCDKRFGTCGAKFGNAKNFRGFPHMPGTDFVTRFAKQGDPANSGGKLS